MRTKRKKLMILLVAIATLGLTTGCGKKSKNRVNSDQALLQQGQFPGYNGTPIPGVNPQAINQLKSQTPCSAGGQRLPDLIFSTQSIAPMGNTTTISGPFQQGGIGGQGATTYAGISYFGDLMIVTKMVNGTQVIGFNVVLSMCTQQNLIMPGRQLTGFNAPFGIVLYDHTNCGFGNVDAASRTTLQAAPFQIFPATVVETTFGPGCSGGGGGYY